MNSRQLHSLFINTNMSLPSKHKHILSHISFIVNQQQYHFFSLKQIIKVSSIIFAMTKSDADQFTCGFMQSKKLIIMKPSRPLEVRQSYLLIPKSDEGKLGGVGKLIERGHVFYKNFPIPTLNYQVKMSCQQNSESLVHDSHLLLLEQDCTEFSSGSSLNLRLSEML